MSPAGAGDELLRRILVRRQFLPSVATQVLSIGRQLQEMSRATGHEWAGAVDAATGSTLAPLIEGTADEVLVGSLLRAMAPGHHYLVIHTHRASMSFSLQDVGILMTAPLIAASAVVCANGHWFLATKRSDSVGADELDVRLGYIETLEALRPTYAALVAQGHRSLDEANRRLSHDIWLLLARALDLRYDWTNPALSQG